MINSTDGGRQNKNMASTKQWGSVQFSSLH